MLPGKVCGDVFCEQVRAVVALSRAAGTRCHRDCRQSQDSHLGWLLARARAGLTELQVHLFLVYTPAYDLDANRIEWHEPLLATGRDASSSPQHVRASAGGCGAA